MVKILNEKNILKLQVEKISKEKVVLKNSQQIPTVFSPQKEGRLNKLNIVKNIFFKTTSEKVNHSARNHSIFSQRFIDLLILELGDSLDFNKKKIHEKAEIASKVNDLFLVETDWKSMISKSHFDNELIKRMFPQELNKFNGDFKHMFYPENSDSNSRTKDKYGSSKCEKFNKGFLKYLQYKKSPLLDRIKLSELESEDITMVSEGTLFSTYIFSDLIKICMKQSFDNRINITSSYIKYTKKILEENFLYIKKDALMYSIQKCIFLYLSNEVISRVKDIKKGSE